MVRVVVLPGGAGRFFRESMKLIAIEAFRPCAVARLVNPGDTINPSKTEGLKFVAQGLAVSPKRAREFALAAARDRAVPFRETR
jgi:hypothetical protein